MGEEIDVKELVSAVEILRQAERARERVYMFHDDLVWDQKEI